MKNKFAVDISNVTVQRDDRTILRDLSWQVRVGDCWAVLGPNGAGKSTLIRVLTAYLWPSEGSVSLLGHVLGRVNVHELRRHIGLVGPTGAFKVDPRLPARSVVLTGFFGTLGLFDAPAPAQLRHADDLLDDLSLAHLALQRYGLLSSGEQTRVLLARALAARPQLLLLDEPTSGLDLPAREAVLATIDRLARRPHAPSLVVVTHRPEELPPVVDHALLLSQGRALAAGPIRTVLTDQLLSRAYGCPIHVHRRHNRWFLSVHPSTWASLLGPPAGQTRRKCPPRRP